MKYQCRGMHVLMFLLYCYKLALQESILNWYLLRRKVFHNNTQDAILNITLITLNYENINFSQNPAKKKLQIIY